MINNVLEGGPAFILQCRWMFPLADKFSCDLQGGILYKCQANILMTEPYASLVSLLQDSLWGALHWHYVSDMLPPEQRWYTATSRQCNPWIMLSYLLPFNSFFFQFLSFICFVIRWPWIQDINLFDTPCQTVVLWTEESCLLFEFKEITLRT
jgi:hypothetical protein